MAALQPGGLLARRYRLIDQIGAGGMSVIWRARDEVLERMVAVKVLAASLAADAKFRDMVREEARAAAQLVHPHVTSVHDYGEAFAPDGTVTAFVVMELLTGEELETLLRDGPLPWPEAVEICAQVAEALAAAHRMGIVHRDITPSNIMMTTTGAKVLDFGIATHVGAPDEDEDGETFGTPAYVAPERLDGTPAQPATDTYSLGVLLYETLTGQVPYPAETWEDLTEALHDGDVPPLTGVPDLPAGVAAVCLRCLARDPVQRPTARQAGELLRAELGRAGAATTGGTGLPPAPPPPIPPPIPPRPASAAERRDRARAQAPSPLPDWDFEGDRERPPSPAPRPPSTPSKGPSTPPREPAPGAPVEHVQRAGEPVRRRVRPRALGLAAGTVALLGLAVLVGAALDQPRPPRQAGLAETPAASEPAGPGPTTPPAPEAPATPPPARSTGITAVPTFGEAVAQLDQVIGDGLASGAIRDDVAVDLRNHLRNLPPASGLAPGDLTRPVEVLREKIATRVREGAITAGYAKRLDGALAQLAVAA